MKTKRDAPIAKTWLMKKQVNPNVNAHLIRGALYLLLLLAVSVIPMALSQRSIDSARDLYAKKGRPNGVPSGAAGVIGREIVGAIPEGGPCQYSITFGSNTIVPGTTDTGNHCAWCDTMINLPFPFVLYDQSFNAVMVNSSGRLDFVCNNEPSNYTETCLPAPPNNCPYDYTIFALWAEWSTDIGATECSTWPNGCGIFTSVSGAAPNRIFNIEWHAVSRDSEGLTANFEVRLYENSPNKRFDVIYGVIQHSSSYVSAGVQGPTGSFTGDFCNVPPPQNVSSTYTMLTCGSPTPTATPTTRVTNTNDSGPGSLRQALADAHNGDTIIFDSSLNGRNIGLTSDELVIDKNVTINGPGANSLGVYRSSNPDLRIFHVMPGATVTITGLTVSGGGGDQPGGGGALNDHAMLTMNNCVVQNNGALNGGGVYNDGSAGSATLTILNSTVSGNYGHYAGGGIYNDASNSGNATASLINCTVDGNIASYSGSPFGGGDGGGIYNNSGTLAITNSLISNNRAGVTFEFPAGSGGGIVSYGTLTITNSAVSGNQAPVTGGGIAGGGVVTITSSTISGNGAYGQHDGQPWGHGGGISGSITFNNSTLSGNYANLSAGGIEGSGVITNSTISDNSTGGISATGTLEIGNSVLKAGASGPNISNHGGTIISHGYNVCSDNGSGFLNGPGDQINTDPMLGPLQNNGGPTSTHALLPSSPAIDEGDPNFIPPPYYDQRGPVFWRVRNGRIDVGSFEVQQGTTPSPTPTLRSSPAPRIRPTPPPRP